MTAKTRKPTVEKSSEREEKSFSTVHETISHFFPETKERDGYVKGEERGTEEAERVFSEITQSIRP
jgi:hypothetical protein